MLLVVTMLNMPQFTSCNQNPPVSDHERWFRAAKVVVQPWRGPHHVYGVFFVPKQYRRDRLYKAKLVVQGLTEELPETSPASGGGYDGRVDPGLYAMQLYLPTRMAIWLLFTGRFGDLNAACHWWIVIADR